MANVFSHQYKREYDVIRNLPVLQKSSEKRQRKNFLVYQGAVNEGRGFEALIPAMKAIPYKLIVCGDGNYMSQLKRLIAYNNVEAKVELKGMLLPNELRAIASEAALGIGMAEREGINQYHALPNKFLDYMHAGLPQIAMNFPEYQKINREFCVAVLLDDLVVEKIVAAINNTMGDQDLLANMHNEALRAREIFCWQAEEKILLQFYQRLFGE